MTPPPGYQYNALPQQPPNAPPQNQYVQTPPTQQQPAMSPAYRFAQRGTMMMMRAVAGHSNHLPPLESDDDEDVPPDIDADEEIDVSVARVTPAQSGISPDVTIIDSGATHLVTPHIDDLVNPVPSPVTTIAGISGVKQVQIMQDSIYLFGHWFHAALCVPRALNVLVPVTSILKAFGGDVAMSILNCRHFSPGGIITVLGPCIQDGLYSLVNLPGHHLRVNLATAMSLSTTNQLKRERVMKLHEKFGHLSKSKMRIALAQQPAVDGLQPKDLDLWVECAVCAEANSQAVPHPKKAIVKTSFYGGQRIDWDLTGPQVTQTPGGATVGMLDVCRHTNTWFVFALRSKTEAPDMVEFTIAHRCNGKTEICGQRIRQS